MRGSDRWLVTVFVITFIVFAIMIVLCSCLFPGSMSSDLVMSSVFHGFMLGKMFIMM